MHERVQSMKKRLGVLTGLAVLLSLTSTRPRNLTAFALALVVLLGGARFANADIIIEASIDGGATFTTLATSTTSSDFISASNFTLGNFTITASAQSNSPGGFGLSKLLSNTLSISNNGTGTQSILLVYGAQGFTHPVGLVGMNSHIGGSVVTDSAANTLAFQSYVDTGNGLGHSGIPGTFTTGSQVVSATTGSFQSDAHTSIVGLTGPYSISQQITLTLGAGSELNTADNTTLTPEPSSFVLLAGSFLGIGGAGRWFRRKRLA
jgi:hypothetical protein